MGKIYVIGDIHGCYRSLENLFQKIAPSPETDTIIFLGDYIDRGPASKKVVDKIIKIQNDFRQIITLMGNHEQMLLRYLTGRDIDVFLQAGGEQTINSYGLKHPEKNILVPDITLDHIQFFNKLLPYWEDENYIYVHAGLQPGIDLHMQSEDWLFWARERFIHSDYNFGKRIIFGHTHFSKPKIEKNKIGIDTGAVYGGSLTCLILPEMKFVSVKGSRFWPVTSGS